MELLNKIAAVWHWVLVALHFAGAVWASLHAVLRKRDSRAAVLWVGVIWLAPGVGPVLYALFGINRIERRAISLWSGYEQLAGHGDNHHAGTDEIVDLLPDHAVHLDRLVSLVNGVTDRPLLRGNKIEPLVGGELAYPEMLRAMDQATNSITMATYIFDWDQAGKEFVKALAAAAERGVDVRVIIDDAGARYSSRSVDNMLRKSGVKCVRFLRTLDLWNMMGLNLRNHRKLLVVDGQIGFTGGMNIREGCRRDWDTKNPITDVHFRIDGPVVSHLQEAFATDWLFVTDESLIAEKWFPELKPGGSVVARGISDGPDAELRKLRWTILGALNSARSSVQIVTPYFLPDEVLVAGLNQAARRGVHVDIVLPEKGNLAFVQWAMWAGYWKMLRHGVRIWLSPPPFDHSKLMVVDSSWTLIGSSNWDPRSLRLNFEFNIECYDGELASAVSLIIDEKLRSSRPLTLAEADGRTLPTRLRDGVARLFTPFL